MFLKKGRRYFIEALHKQGAREDHILVGWKVPGLSGFRHISGDSISMYIDDRYTSPDVTDYAKYIPQTIPSHTHSHTWSVNLNQDFHKFGSNRESNEYTPHQLVEMKDFDNVLPNCVYQPSYLVNFTLKRYEGVKLIHDSAVYPDDLTILTHMIPYDQCKGRRMIDSHSNGLNVSIPALTNHSLFHEGKIKVFGPDGNGSVVTTPSDLDEDYPIEHVLKADESNATDTANVSLNLDDATVKEKANVENKVVKKPHPLRSQSQVVNDNEESKHLLHGIRNHAVPLQNQIGKRTNLKTRVSNNDNIHILNHRANYLAKESLEALKNLPQSHQNEYKNYVIIPASNTRQPIKQSHDIQENEVKVTRIKQIQELRRKNNSLQKRTMENNSRNIKSKVKNTQQISKTTILSNEKLPISSRSKRAFLGKDIQRKNPTDMHDQRKEKRSYEEVRNAQTSRQRSDEESRRSQQKNEYGLQRNSRTRRKLLYYPTKEESKDDDNDAVCPYIMSFILVFIDPFMFPYSVIHITVYQTSIS